MKALVQNLNINTKFLKSGISKNGKKWQSFSVPCGKSNDGKTIYWKAMYFGDQDLTNLQKITSAEVTIKNDWSEYKHANEVTVIVNNFFGEKEEEPEEIKLDVNQEFKMEELPENKTELDDLNWAEAK